MISYRAPAKIILSGEHSVVYTKPALVSAIDTYLTVTLQESKTVTCDPRIKEALEFIQDIVISYLKKEHVVVSEKPFACIVESDIPEGRGMGSSAAFCVAIVASLLHWYTGHEWAKETINNLAYQSEKHFHGMPSGVDVSASCMGGLIFYRKEFEFLKYISALNFKIPKNIQDHLILIDSGKPEESTAEMVSLVGRRYNKNPQETEHILAQIEKITKRMVIAIVKEDRNLFAECIHENQKLLVQLGIVSAECSDLISRLAPFGVGKVTGAGGLKKGSGMILFYVEKQEAFDHFCSHENIIHTPFKQNYSGVVRL